MVPAGLMSPEAITKELARRREQLTRARREGRGLNAVAHAERIRELEDSQARAEEAAAEFAARHPAPAPESEAAAPPPAPAPVRQLATDPQSVPDAAVHAAQALLAKWGLGASIRALCLAAGDDMPASMAADVADGVRLHQLMARVDRLTRHGARPPQ